MPGPDTLTKEAENDILLHKVVALDFETNNSFTPRDGKITGLGVGCNNKSYYFEWSPEVKEFLIKIVSDPERICCWHNFKFDSKWLISEGIEWKCKMACTMIMWYLLDERRFGKYALKGPDGAAKLFYGIDLVEYKDAIQGDLFTSYTFADYARNDVLYGKRLFDDKYLEIEEQGLKNVYWDFDCEVSAITGQMEEAGLYFDIPKLEEMAKKDLEEMKQIEEESVKDLGFRIDLSSPAQVSDVIFRHLKLSPLEGMKLGDNGKYSCDDQVLDLLSTEYPNCNFLNIERNYRSVAKNYSSYTGKYLKLARKGNGYVYSDFNIVRTETGRFSGGFQQFPRVGDEEDPGIRKAICAPDGYLLLDLDMSQIELRLAAHVAKDKLLIQAYNENKDVHQLHADLWNCSRDDGKKIVFALLYSGHWFMLYHLLNKTRREKNLKQITQDEAQRFYKVYFETKKEIAQWQSDGRRRLHETLCSKTLFGRKRRFSKNELLDEKMEKHCLRQFLNHEIQGTAADIIKRAMIKCDKRFKELSKQSAEFGKVKLCLQVHDELLYRVPEGIAKDCLEIVKHEMENSVKGLRVSLKANGGIGKAWCDAKH